MRVLQRLEAPALERALGVLDGRLDFALPIGVPDATGQGHGAVVREHGAIERIQGGVIDVRLQDPFLQIVEHDDPD